VSFLPCVFLRCRHVFVFINLTNNFKTSIFHVEKQSVGSTAWPWSARTTRIRSFSIVASRKKVVTFGQITTKFSRNWLNCSKTVRLAYCCVTWACVELLLLMPAQVTQQYANLTVFEQLSQFLLNFVVIWPNVTTFFREATMLKLLILVVLALQGHAVEPTDCFSTWNILVLKLLVKLMKTKTCLQRRKTQGRKDTLSGGLYSSNFGGRNGLIPCFCLGKPEVHGF
jgi:hypothetical protein